MVSTDSSCFGCSGFGAAAFNGDGYAARPAPARRWFPGLARRGPRALVLLPLVFGVPEGAPVSVLDLVGWLAWPGVAGLLSVALSVSRRWRRG
jgi:hypothetical protein